MRVTRPQAEAFAHEWIEAWNAHDLPRILAHYREDFTMASPFIADIAGEPSGVLHGKPAVAAYWQAALARKRDLHFTLLDVLVSAESFVILYRNQAGILAAETFFPDAQGLVARAAAHYAENPTTPVTS